jgi:hypothetical protein
MEKLFLLLHGVKHTFANVLFAIVKKYKSGLKGPSHENVGKMRVLGVSLDPK